MTGVAIRIDVEGREATVAVLREAIAQTDDKRGLHDAIGASLVLSTQQRFEREEDPDGNPWPASLRNTLFGGRTLTDTARLVQSITHLATDDRVEVGTNAVYAAIHQHGGTIRPRVADKLTFRLPGGGFVSVDEVEMPRRAFLGLDDDDDAEIRALVADWLVSVEGGDDAR